MSEMPPAAVPPNPQGTDATNTTLPEKKFRLPMFAKILIGVGLGMLFGMWLGSPELPPGWDGKTQAEQEQWKVDLADAIDTGIKKAEGILKAEETKKPDEKRLKAADVGKVFAVLDAVTRKGADIKKARESVLAELDKDKPNLMAVLKEYNVEQIPFNKRKFASQLKDVGLLVIRLLKTLATPLIFFAILDSFLRIYIPPAKGAKLIMLSSINAIVSIVIGLSLMNALRWGEAHKDDLSMIKKQVVMEARLKGTKPAEVKKVEEATLDPLTNFSSYIPENMVDPFAKNSVITVALMTLLAGAALRSLKDRKVEGTEHGVKWLEDIIHTIYRMVAQMLEWVVWTLPVALFLIIAGVIADTGWGVFGMLKDFLFVVLLGMFLHAVVYYSFLLVVVGRYSPVRFFTGAWDAIVMSLSVSSSLATLPTTLRCLDKNLKVSPGSARLSACVGTNLNHTGIILYEAVGALFMCQALGLNQDVNTQITIALASIMAGVGIAGVPEAGLIIFALVLTAAGLTEVQVALVVPLVIPVDWICSRCRACVNVLSDMTVAVLLDRLHPDPVVPVVTPAVE